MGEQKHTPGPWSVEENVRAGGVVHLAVTNRSAGDDWMPCSISPQARARPIDYANARLIAAAPALLEACKAAEGVLTEPGIMDVDQWKAWSRKTVDQLRAAIASAEPPAKGE